MKEYRRGAHTVYEIHLHVVWTTKYRKPVLVGEVAVRVRDIVREICGERDIKIMKGHVSKDHVHLLVSIPPQVTISRNDAVAEGKDGAQDDDGVSASEKALLGPTHVGTRIFLL